MKRLLGEIDGGNILDVGCGTGQFTELLIASIYSFETITGIDISDEFLREARHKFSDDRLNFLLADSHSIPFGDSYFDMVAISKALHHIEDPSASLIEMKRVLKPGGYFMINEMHRDGLSETQRSHMLYHHLRSEIDNVLGINHKHTFLREDLVAISDGLELQDRMIMEYNPDDTQAKDPESIEEFCAKMDDWLPALEGHHKEEEFRLRIEELKTTLRDNGISRPPQLVILGRK